MKQLSLTGLDAQNPLAFFAALGLLRVLDDDARRHRSRPPTLHFASEGPPIALVNTRYEVDEVVAVVLDDVRVQADNPALRFAYNERGDRVPPEHPEAIRDLKPPPAAARQLLDECASAPGRVSSLVAGWFSELVTDNNGNTKPSALHFTAGQQSFLEMVDTLRSQISHADVMEALVGPWLNRSTLPSLSWDSSVARSYALRASDPSKERRGSVPAANWLGVIALEFFPVVPVRGRLVTTGVSGGWKDATLRWPLWDRPATARTIASLLRIDARRWTAVMRAAMSIFRVYSADISRSDQGGYGSFSPSSVVLPNA